MSDTNLQRDMKVAKRAIETIQERLISVHVHIADNSPLQWAVNDALNSLEETFDALDTVSLEAGAVPFDL